MSLRITSPQNPKVKFALSLYKAPVRKKECLFIIEGLREIRLAMESGYQFETLFICPETARKNDASQITDDLVGQVQIVETTREIFRKLAYRENSDGLVAIARQKKYLLDDIRLTGIPLLLVIEAVEKPGNLGAILRTADAAGVDAVIVCDTGVDIYNPNVVRSSIGTIFTNRVVCCSSEDAIKWLKRKNIRIYTTALSASKPYHLIDYTIPTAVVSGAEATGVTEIWQKHSDSNIIIPMFGSADSINVSVAVSIVLYEALRQRGF